MVARDEDLESRLFAFQEGEVLSIKSGHGKSYASKIAAIDDAGLIFRRFEDPNQLVFLPWHNVLSIESNAPITDEEIAGND